MAVPSSPEIQTKKSELMAQLQSLLSQEEAFWKQRSKIVWLKEGDRNTSFFHRKASNRRRKNTIHGLFDNQCQWFEDDDGLEHVVTSYFTDMFSANDVDTNALYKVLHAIQPCVTEDMNLMLHAPYSEEEVKTALFQMYPTKSPGPDGMPPLFFHTIGMLLEVMSQGQSTIFFILVLS